MARYTGAVCRICRREGQKLFLKGTKCYTDKCAFAKRSYAPGQHGQSRKKMSEYGMQLREKQKVRKTYGILEGQFEKYFDHGLFFSEYGHCQRTKANVTSPQITI